MSAATQAKPTLNDVIADSLIANPPTVGMGDDWKPELSVEHPVAQLRKPVMVMLPEGADEAAIFDKLTGMEAASTQVTVGVVEAVLERVTRLSIAEGRLKDVHDLDVGNSYAWGAWSSVLTGTALTEDEVGIRTATLDDVVDAINGEADIFYIGKGGLIIF